MRELELSKEERQVLAELQLRRRAPELPRRSLLCTHGQVQPLRQVRRQGDGHLDDGLSMRELRHAPHCLSRRLSRLRVLLHREHAPQLRIRGRPRAERSAFETREQFDCPHLLPQMLERPLLRPREPCSLGCFVVLLARIRHDASERPGHTRHQTRRLKAHATRGQRPRQRRVPREGEPSTRAESRFWISGVGARRGTRRGNRRRLATSMTVVASHSAIQMSAVAVWSANTGTPSSVNEIATRSLLRV